MAAITSPATPPTTHLKTYRFAIHVRVRIRLCSNHCRLCRNGQHEMTEPLDAERLGYRRVRITQPDDVWFGAELCDSDYVIEGA